MQPKVVAVVVLLACPGASAQQPIIGDWIVRNEQMEVRASFRADGTFERITRAGGQTEVVRGQYRLVGKIIDIFPEGGGEKIRMNVRFLDQSTLELTDSDGAGVQMARVPAQAPAKSHADKAQAEEDVQNLFNTGRAPKLASDPMPQRWTVYSHVDQGGIRDYSTGQFMVAFRMLVPKGWKVDGGLVWAYTTKAPQDLSPTDATMPMRCQFVVRSPDGRCAMQSYLQERWCDLSGTPGQQMGLTNFPPGSNYRGMISCPAMSPEQYIVQFVIPRQRGLANPTVVSQDQAVEMARKYYQEADRFNRMAGEGGLGQIMFRAARVVVDYEDNGVACRETFVAIIQYMQTAGMIMWWPRVNFSVRAPCDQYESMVPVFQQIVTSIDWNPRRQVEYERMINKGAVAQAKIDAYVNNTYREILDARAATNSEIGRGMGPLIHPWHYYKGTDGNRHYLDTSKHHFQNADGDIISSNNWEPPEGFTKLEPYIQPYHEP